jgi:hypothetical protein
MQTKVRKVNISITRQQAKTRAAGARQCAPPAKQNLIDTKEAQKRINAQKKVALVSDPGLVWFSVLAI